MKLNIKQLPAQVDISVEVAEDATCEDLKHKIEAEHQHTVAWQKLIFAGRIVTDETRLSEQGIKDGSSMVLVVRKPDGAPAAAAAPAASTAAPAAAAAQPTETPAAATAPAAAVEAPAAAPAQPAFTPSDEALAALLGMGFEREQSVRALRLARNNLQNACDLLLSGAPLPEPTTPAAPATERRDPQQEASSLMNDLIQRMQERTTDPQAQFEWVMQQPQFQRIRSLLQSRPDLFASLLTQLGGTNPQLYELISQNQAEFLEWLNEQEGEGGEGGDVGGGDAGAGGAAGGQQLSQRDEASIARLMELGFDRNVVRQAFLACGRNEEMAANYLFENS